MPVTHLTPEPALVLVDLQAGITAMPLAHPADGVVARAAALAATFRERRLPVVLVTVAFSPDGSDALRPPVDAAPPAASPGPDFAALRPELGATDGDLRIVKRQWDAFFGTELDLQLRRRGVRSVVLAGIATSIGVESTARSAYSLGYEVVVASDAVTDTQPLAHANSLERIFPRLGRVDTTDAVLAALGQA
ncbi:hydrolase [Patulibacter sp. SYSU D01012]|uniref:hydrolase n=1 Tax=Patulibacter sp. SYSU D01012 TaxID=2817381 RepID=UPI001B3185D0|nr:hydrolase [Patulibacter sp. SYSU D01012]